MPSELTLTEDNRAIINPDIPQMATFEASKKLHEVYESPPKKSQALTNSDELKPGSGLERRIEIFEEMADGISQ